MPRIPPRWRRASRAIPSRASTSSIWTGRGRDGRATATRSAASSRAWGASGCSSGGGLRDLAAVETALAAGVERAVLGTVAVREPAVALEAARRFPGRIAVGIDARDG